MERIGAAGRIFFWGGYIGAERRRAIFLPSWIPVDTTSHTLYSREREEHFIRALSECGVEELLGDFTSAVRVRKSGYESLSHRDYLGALMGLGLRRSVIGDICPDGEGAVIFCEDKACAFILEELRMAGRDSVRCERLSTDADFSPSRRFEEIATTVASVRLDGVVRALCNVSRDEAASLVGQGLVDLNYFCEKEPDRRVDEGDIISVRGHGKYIIDRAGDVTRRGRIRLLARKYV